MIIKEENAITITIMDEAHGSGLDMLSVQGINFELNTRIYIHGLPYVVKEILEASAITTYYLLEEVRVPARALKEWLLYSPPYAATLKNYVKKLEAVRDAAMNENYDGLEDALSNAELDRLVYDAAKQATKDSFRILQEQKHEIEDRARCLSASNQRMQDELILLKGLVRTVQGSDDWNKLLTKWELEFLKPNERSKKEGELHEERYV